jgi:hypothetical protein
MLVSHKEMIGGFRKMRFFKMVSGLAAAMCVLGVGAASASASEFESTGGATRGVSVSKLEEFHVYPMNVVCNKAETKGSVAAGKSTTFTDEVKYSACTSFSGLLKMTVSPGHFEYNASGTVAITEPITITSNVLKCHYEIPAQAGFSKESVFFDDVTSFSNKKFPNGQLKLQVESAVQGMHYTAHGWPCTGPKNPEMLKEGRELEEEGEEGAFTGKVEEAVVEGNFTWIK